MSFLAPLWLALGLAAAVPVLLHLLRRRSGTRIEFPAVRFLLRAEKEHRRQMRMRNLLVMLLRVAVVLALALAAAKPLGRAGASGHAPTAVAIVLDNSLSTGAVRGGRMAIDALPGMPNATVGTRSPPLTELFAVSGAMTPRTSPLPNCDLSLALCTAWP